MFQRLHSIFDTAYWFTEMNGGSIHSKKMQKLCYYTQAWSYATRGDIPFFHGEFEAWVHGPVNRELWSQFKNIAYREITLEDFGIRGVHFDEEELEFLQTVWNTYGKFDGYELESLTHDELPWQEQRVGLTMYQPSQKIISTDTMRDYYRSLLVEDGVSDGT